MNFSRKEGAVAQNEVNGTKTLYLIFASTCQVSSWQRGRGRGHQAGQEDPGKPPRRQELPLRQRHVAG